MHCSCNFFILKDMHLALSLKNETCDFGSTSNVSDILIINEAVVNQAISDIFEFHF